MAGAPFAGYVGQVWGTCWQAMSWLNTLLAGGTAPASQTSAGAQAVFSTLKNGVAAINAFQTAAALASEAQNLQDVQNMLLPIDSLSASYVSARVSATIAAAKGIAALQPTASPFAASGLLATGKPAIADPGFLEWCMVFNDETAPALLLSLGVSACAAQAAAAWFTTSQAIQVAQGGLPRTDYRFDAAARTWRTANRIATMVSQFQSGTLNAATADAPDPITDSFSAALTDSGGNALDVNPVSGTSNSTWNTAVALPSILLSAASLSSAPSTLGAQQAGVARYILTSTMMQLAQFLLSLRSPQNGSTPGLATLRNGESLQDLAARTTGNFEDWQSIAAANNLVPPYPGRSNTALALSGQQLLLPAAGSTTTSGSAGTYFSNVLGTDWDFGPINKTQPAWTGDIPLITGYLNFARALGRRIQTPLGTLIYHTSYGSRIPPEVGAIQSQDEAARLSQYGKSAIAADPRTGEILSSVATTQPGMLATYSALILPIGPGSTPVTINETISPLA